MTTLQELHDRATQGLLLTDAEQAQLEAWYAQQDEAEKRLLNTGETPQAVEKLQAQIKAALVQMAAMTQRIQELMRQNEELRREIASLNHQLTQRLTVYAV